MDDNHRTHGVEPLKLWHRSAWHGHSYGRRPEAAEAPIRKKRIRPAYRDELKDHLQRLTSERAAELAERIARLLAGEFSNNYSGALLIAMAYWLTEIPAAKRKKVFANAMATLQVLMHFLEPDDHPPLHAANLEDAPVRARHRGRLPKRDQGEQ